MSIPSILKWKEWHWKKVMEIIDDAGRYIYY